MAYAQLNVRLDEDLKRRGNAVLERGRLGSSGDQTAVVLPRRDAAHATEAAKKQRRACSAKASPHEPGLAFRLAYEAGVISSPRTDASLAPKDITDGREGDDADVARMTVQMYADKLAEHERRWRAHEHA